MSPLKWAGELTETDNAVELNLAYKQRLLRKLVTSVERPFLWLASARPLLRDTGDIFLILSLVLIQESPEAVHTDESDGGNHRTPI